LNGTGIVLNSFVVVAVAVVGQCTFKVNVKNPYQARGVEFSSPITKIEINAK
jgi:hypothetical protein